MGSRELVHDLACLERVVLGQQARELVDVLASRLVASATRCRPLVEVQLSLHAVDRVEGSFPLPAVFVDLRAVAALRGVMT